MRLYSRRIQWIEAVFFLICSHTTFAHTDASPVALKDRLIQAISQYYPKTRIELLSEPEWLRWNKTETSPDTYVLSLMGDDGRGQMRFQLEEKGYIRAEGQIKFSAWTLAHIALRRIQPRTLLTQEWFEKKEINIAQHPFYESRSILFPARQNVQGFESLQTTLAGYPLLLSTLQKTPDVRRGDPVQIELVSHGLVIHTAGVAEEEGYLNQILHVRTGKTKRELTGRLLAEGKVEVRP